MRKLIGIALLFAAAFMPAARAGDPDVKELEKTFQKLAKEATPKTVCIKSYIEKTGDKAGYGSGAIISADGYILTCAHVVDIAKRCEVILPSGKTFPAKMLGKNKKQDYALVKIEAEGLPFYEIGDSKSLEVGAWVVALGHPGGPYEDVQPAFAAGKITALHRKLPVQMMDRFYDDGIQTDVPIFAGNSGGPLVDLKGKLIGLNGAIILINDNAFALPIHEPMADMDALKAGELVAGRSPTSEDMAQFQREIDPEMWNQMLQRGLKNLGKVFGGDGKGGENPLEGLLGKGGGEQLGKMLGKLFGGEKKEGDEEGDEEGEGADLQKMVQGFMKMFQGKNGEAPDLGKLMKELQKMFSGDEEGDEDGEDAEPAPNPGKPGAPKLERNQPKANAKDKGGYLGVSAATDAGDVDGVLVDSVLDGGPADKGGIQKGDLIVAFEGRGVKDINELRAAIAKIDVGSDAKVTVVRGKKRVDVTVTIQKRK